MHRKRVGYGCVAPMKVAGTPSQPSRRPERSVRTVSYSRFALYVGSVELSQAQQLSFDAKSMSVSERGPQFDRTRAARIGASRRGSKHRINITVLIRSLLTRSFDLRVRTVEVSSSSTNTSFTVPQATGPQVHTKLHCPEAKVLERSEKRLNKYRFWQSFPRYSGSTSSRDQRFRRRT